MALLNDANRAQYTGNGLQTTFPYTFKVLDAADMQVFVDGVLQPDGYTVTGVGEDNGGTVVFATAPPDPSIVTLVRVVPLTQPTVYAPGSKFPAAVHEGALDRIVMQNQQQGEAISRSIIWPVETVGASNELPNPNNPDAHGRALFVNATGTGIELREVADGSTQGVLLEKGDLATHTGTATTRLPSTAQAGDLLIVQPADAEGLRWLPRTGGKGSWLIRRPDLDNQLNYHQPSETTGTIPVRNMDQDTGWTNRTPATTSGQILVSDMSHPARMIWQSPQRHQGFNPIINSAFDLVQNHSGDLNPISNGDYSADMWRFGLGGSGAYRSRVLTAPSDLIVGGHRVQRYLRFDTHTTHSVTASDSAVSIHRMEGMHAALFHDAGPLTLSFAFAADVPGTYCVSITSTNASRCIVLPFTISSANTWERVVLPVPNMDTGVGTWDTATGIGLQIRFALHAGSDLWTATPNEWISENLIGVSNMVQVVQGASRWIAFTAVQLDYGTIALPYRYEVYPSTLRQCKRYWQQSYPEGASPGTVTDAGQIRFRSASSGQHNTVFLQEDMRANPGVTLYSPTTGASGQWRNDTGSADTAIAVTEASRKSFAVSLSSGSTANIRGHWTADARL